MAAQPRPYNGGVITAIVIVSVQADKIPEVAQAIAEIDGVSEVYSVAGDADLIAIVRVREFDQIAEVIAGRLSKVTGVVHTDTHIAFRAYSRHDLDATFSIGLD
jgi:DNA-binding Lrp family transcriptional regulator